jgi:hypothetical protein
MNCLALSGIKWYKSVLLICYTCCFFSLDIAWPDLFPCIQWMKPFAAAVQEQGTVDIRLFEKVCY